MPDPCIAAVADTEAVSVLSALEQSTDVEQTPESFEFSESDWAVALFEHPGH